MQSSRGRQRHGRALLVSSLGIALISSVSFFLGTTGSVGTSIAPPAGSPTSGFADVTALSAAVTRTNGGAQLQTGVALAKIVMSSAVTSSALVNIAWTNVAQATQVLNNPNSQISIGLYYTIHSGFCNSSSKTSVDAPLVNLTDSDSSQYCLALDQSATGRFASSTGKLLLTGNQVGGFLMPNLTPSTLAACTTSSVDTGPWCQPASVTNASQRALWVIASITTPGGIPQGQQGNINTLSFFIAVQAS